MPNPGYPSPRTWTNDVIPFPWLRADVAGAAALLQRPPVFLGFQQAPAQAVDAPVDGVAVDLNGEWYDPYNMHRLQGSGIHLSRAYPYLPGWYLAQACTPMGASPSGATGAGIGSVQDGGAYTIARGQMGLVNNTSWPCAPVACDLVQVAQTGYGTGDYAEPVVFGDGNTETTGSLYPRFEMRWVGALSGVQPLPAPPITPVPQPPAYLDADWLNANIRDTVGFMLYPPFGCWTQSSAIPIASQAGLPLTGTRLTLNSTRVSSYPAMNLATSTYTAPEPGSYWTYVCMTAAAGTNPVAIAAGATVTSANYNSGTQVTLWGGGQAVDIVQSPLVNATVFRRRLRLNAGDTIIPAGFYRDSGGVPGAVTTRLIIIWRSL